MTVYFLVPVCRYHLMYILYNLFYCAFNMHIITGKDKLNIKLNKYGQLMYGKKSKHLPSLSDFNVNVIIQTKFELFIIRCSSIYATIVEPHRVKSIRITHPFH